MPQSKRTETLDRFRNGEIRLLVASDVAARGLDIQGLSHVFCFDVPVHAEDYVHRIGRTGRAGREGRSFMLAAPEDGYAVTAIANLIGKEIPPITIDGVEASALEFNENGRRRPRRGSATAKPRPIARRRAENGNGAAHLEAEHRAVRRNRRPSPAEAPQRNGGEANVTVFPRPTGAHGSRQPERKREPEQVVGFGDHLPAFLARPPRIAARP